MVRFPVLRLIWSVALRIGVLLSRNLSQGKVWQLWQVELCRGKLEVAYRKAVLLQRGIVWLVASEVRLGLNTAVVVVSALFG